MDDSERLPPAATEEALHAVVGDESALRPGVDALAGILGLDPTRLGRLPNGSLPVYADEHRVLKLFPPFVTAAAHVEVGVLEDWWPQDWPAFVAAQRATALQRHRRWGLPRPWLEQVDTFLAGTPLPTRAPVLLHTEVMPSNLLAARDGNGRWSLSGLCDFEPAMRGSSEYDLVAVAVFMAGGDPDILRAALLAYGYEAAQLDEGLSRRLLAWTLLHRFGDVAACFDLLPTPTTDTFAALAVSWFGLAPSEGAD